MREGQVSSWLTDFADEQCKTVEASYLDNLKMMIETKSDKKFATIEDALESFSSRLSLPMPDVKQIRAGVIGTELNAIMAALGVKAFNTDEIDKEINHGMPADAIANQFGNTEEEKQAIVEYVDSQADKHRTESSEIARDMRMTEDQAKPMNNTPSPKMSSFRSLSTKKG